MSDPVFEDNAMTGPVFIYGVVANVATWVPWLLYVILDPGSTGIHSINYFQMLTIAYGPMSIAWWMCLLFDSQQARDKLIYSLSTTKLGPFGLMPVGLATFIMNGSNAMNLGDFGNLLTMFIFMAVNFGAVLLHVSFGPKVYVWAKKAPLPADAPSMNPAEKEVPEPLVPGPEFTEAEKD